MARTMRSALAPRSRPGRRPARLDREAHLGPPRLLGELGGTDAGDGGGGAELIALTHLPPRSPSQAPSPALPVGKAAVIAAAPGRRCPSRGRRGRLRPGRA